MTEFVQNYTQNKVGKDWLVGDIHGFYEELLLALKAKNFDFEKDRLFAVGDLVDRGTENKKVVQLIEQDWFISVRGNHDQFVIDQRFEPLLFSGQWKSHSRYAIPYQKENHWFKALDESIQIYLANTLNTLPFAIELESHGIKIGICHAGVPVEFDDWNEFIDELSNPEIREKALRTREPAKQIGWSRIIENIDITVHGHTTFEKPMFCTFSCFIDTFGKTGEFNLISVEKLAEKVRKKLQHENSTY